MSSLVASADPLELHKSLLDKAKQHLPHNNNLEKKRLIHIRAADFHINDIVKQKTLTCWTDHTCRAFLRVSVRPRTTGDGLAGPDGRLAPERRCRCKPSTQQRRGITAAAGGLPHRGRPTERTGKWLRHPTMWTVTPCGRHTIILVPLNHICFNLMTF